MAKIITIDGPASSGKNSVGHLLSKKLGYQFIDTGSIYRIFSLFVLRNHLDISPPEDLETLKNINVSFKTVDDSDFVYADGEDVTDKLHLPEVTELVPKVAAIKRVREIAKGTQRELGLSQNTVMTGRDIGTEIFPEAEHKFFLTADLETRAKRRFEQLKIRDPNLTLEEVIKQTMQRDSQDSEREVSPMRVPSDAVTIDTTHLTIEQSVDKILSFIA